MWILKKNSQNWLHFQFKLPEQVLRAVIEALDVSVSLLPSIFSRRHCFSRVFYGNLRRGDRRTVLEKMFWKPKTGKSFWFIGFCFWFSFWFSFHSVFETFHKFGKFSPELFEWFRPGEMLWLFIIRPGWWWIRFPWICGKYWPLFMTIGFCWFGFCWLGFCWLGSMMDSTLTGWEVK